MVHFKIIITLSYMLVADYFTGGAGIELTVFEGGTLAVFTTTARPEEDPQIIFSRLNGTSVCLIAQFACHNLSCTNECPDHAFLLQYDKQNLSIAFVNASCGQTGLYEVRVFSKTPSENRVHQFNITVIELPLSTISSEAPPYSEMSKSVSAGLSLAGAVAILVFFIVVIIIRNKPCIEIPCDVP